MQTYKRLTFGAAAVAMVATGVFGVSPAVSAQDGEVMGPDVEQSAVEELRATTLPATFERPVVGGPVQGLIDMSGGIDRAVANRFESGIRVSGVAGQSNIQQAAQQIQSGYVVLGLKTAGFPPEARPAATTFLKSNGAVGAYIERVIELLNEARGGGNSDSDMPDNSGQDNSNMTETETRGQPRPPFDGTCNDVSHLRVDIPGREVFGYVNCELTEVRTFRGLKLANSDVQVVDGVAVKKEGQQAEGTAPFECSPIGQTKLPTGQEIDGFSCA